MEKEEETTRELLLPNWQGSGSHGLTIAQRDDGVFVQEVMQNSPAARTGVVKEGDQIVGATIYFDNLQSGEVTQLLNTMGHHTVGLKLHRKGDRSPEPGQTWTHEVFSSRSSEVVLSGDDEDYQRIYTTKIKPRLRSEDGVEGDLGETQSRTITVTRRVTAYTVDVTGREGVKDIDITSPEFMIKIPRHEVTEISNTDVETQPGKTVIRLPSGSGPASPTTGSAVDIRAGAISASGPELEGAGHSKFQVTVPGAKDVDLSLGSCKLKGNMKTSAPEVKGDVKGPQMAVKGSRVDIETPNLEGTLTGPKISSPSGKIGACRISMADVDLNVAAPKGKGGVDVILPNVDVPKLEGDLKGPNVDMSRPDIEIEGPEGKLKGPKFKMPEMNIKAPKISMPDFDLHLKGPKVKGDVDISLPKVEGDIKGPEVDIKGPKVDINAPEVELSVSTKKE